VVEKKDNPSFKVDMHEQGGWNQNKELVHTIPSTASICPLLNVDSKTHWYIMQIQAS